MYQKCVKENNYPKLSDKVKCLQNQLILIIEINKQHYFFRLSNKLADQMTSTKSCCSVSFSSNNGESISKPLETICKYCIARIKVSFLMHGKRQMQFLFIKKVISKCQITTDLLHYSYEEIFERLIYNNVFESFIINEIICKYISFYLFTIDY